MDAKEPMDLIDDTQQQQQQQQRGSISDEDLKRMLREDRRSGGSGFGSDSGSGGGGGFGGFLDSFGYCLATLAIIAVCIVVYIVEVLAAGMSFDIDANTLFEMGAMFAPAIQSPLDAWRLVTPMFLHVDVMHIIFNMAALFSVGAMLEQTLGRGNFLLLYFVAGITGNAVSYAADVMTGSYVVSAGASTSIFGLFVAVALLGVLLKGNRSIYREYSKGMLAMIVINLVYTFAIPSVSISGHLGGAVGGAVAMLMIPASCLRVPKAIRIVVAVAWVAAIAAIFLCL